ncbi:MAG TPA: thioesterase domain-containing protein [Geomonas sp.]|nr:thioesterase domain-containing protein [Geomonas sp.]
METLYLCGAGNPEGVRLALSVNKALKRWDRIVILDDDPVKHGRTLLGVEIAGPFSLLEGADPATAEVANLVARTASGRMAAWRKIEQYGIPFATLIAPEVDVEGIDLAANVTVYRNAMFCANATVGEGSVIFGATVIGHGCRLGTCCVVAPGAVINARVKMGDGVYVGSNASIMPELQIGDGAVIGANSAVIQHVPAGASVMGVPALIVMQKPAAAGQGEAATSVRHGFELPLSELERALAKVWMKVLKVERVGRHDSFFDLGGSSLDAVNLFVELEQMFHKRLPLSVLLQAPTLKELASFIGEGGQTPDWSSLVPIRGEGSLSPLFLVHGAEGNVLLYRDLARHLPKELPVFGLQSRGLDGRGSLLTTIEEMAACYIREIKSVQPQGPYLLGGYCLGGIVALEMAQQLRAMGESTALVSMIESYNVHLSPGRRSPVMSLCHLLQNVGYHLGNLFSIGMSERLQFLQKKMAIEKGRVAVKVASLGRGKDRYPHLAVTEANEEAASGYVPGEYAGRVVVFRPRVNFLGQNDPAFGWGEVVRGGLSVCSLPFYPKAMLVEPFVRTLAGEINRCLAEALAAERGNAHLSLQGTPVDDLVGEIDGVLETAQEIHP